MNVKCEPMYLDELKELLKQQPVDMPIQVCVEVYVDQRDPDKPSHFLLPVTSGQWRPGEGKLVFEAGDIDLKV